MVSIFSSWPPDTTKHLAQQARRTRRCSVASQAKSRATLSRASLQPTIPASGWPIRRKSRSWRFISAESRPFRPWVPEPRCRESRPAQARDGSRRRIARLNIVSRCPTWVMGCRQDQVGSTTGVPQIVADLLRRASRRSRPKPTVRFSASFRLTEGSPLTTRQNLCAAWGKLSRECEAAAHQSPRPEDPRNAVVRGHD